MKTQITFNSKTGALIQKDFLHDVPDTIGIHQIRRSIDYYFLNGKDKEYENWVTYCPLE